MNNKSPNKDNPKKIKFLSPVERVEFLEKRRLIFQDKERAVKKLHSIGYENLELYEHYFLIKNTDKFRPKTKFEHIVLAYEADEILRISLLFALIRIEKFLKNRLITYFRKLDDGEDPFIHEKLEYFKVQDYQSYINIVNLVTRKKIKYSEANRIVKEYIDEYGDEGTFPTEKFINFLTFGEFTQLYNALSEEHQYKFVNSLKIPQLHKKFELFHNWIHALSDMRNVCAHNDLLFGRKLLFHLFENKNTKYTESIGNFLYVVNIIISSEFFDQDFTPRWKNEFIDIIDKTNNKFNIDLDFFDLYKIMDLNKDQFINA